MERIPMDLQPRPIASGLPPVPAQWVDVPVQPVEEPPPTQVLADLWAAVRRHKALTAILAILGAAAGFGAYLWTPPVYLAVTTLELQGLNEQFMNLNQVDPQAGTGSYSPTQLNLATQLKIIESSTLRGAVLERLDRETTPIPLPKEGIRGRVHDWLGIGISEDPLQETKNALFIAGSTVQARPITGTRILMVSAESTIPEVAANFVNTLANEYISQSFQQRTGTAQRTNQWLESQLEETKAKLAQSEARLQEYVRKSGVLFMPESETLAQTKIRQLQNELSAIQADRIAKQSRYEMAQRASAEALADTVGDQSLKTLEAQLVELRRQRAVLLNTFTPAHPKVQAIDIQITEIETARRNQRDNTLAGLRNEYEAALRKEKLLGSAYGAQSGVFLAQADKSVEYGLLKREVELLRMYLNGLLQQVNNSSVAAAIPANNVRVIDAARRPGFPYRPSSLKYTAYGLGGGVSFGLALAFGIEWLRRARGKRHFADPGHSPTLLRAPELGVIPSLEMQRFGGPRRRLAIFGASDLGEEPQRVELAAAQESIMADSFRMVLASIKLMNRDRQAPTRLLVTSPGPREGKTTIITNLAVIMAEAGYRVILLDTDLRRPRLHEVFGLDNARGFADLILPDATVTASELLRATQMPRLRVVPAGTIDNYNVINNLFYSPKVPALLDELQRATDVLLIDAPPMLQFSETRLMASLTDGVVLVLRSGSTDSDAAMLCRQRLAEDHIPLLGTVLNDWNPKDRSHPYYHSTYRYYAEPDERKVSP